MVPKVELGEVVAERLAFVGDLVESVGELGVVDPGEGPGGAVRRSGPPRRTATNRQETEQVTHFREPDRLAPGAAGGLL
ncbi:MAG: hypothetical protein MUP76_02690 [Acidimicrobiia bacterium]|nr:hypothetical protein [Acidimicrobiia bacterium]